MQRLVYAPEVTAYIRSDEGGLIFDVSEDIISGSVTRRLDAASSASLVLQNKFGKFTRKIKPMDRIAIFMRRIGDPILVFTGYVDESPFYQIRPGPVTINATCTLKILQNTYFDPGLPFMTQWMSQFGWVYDPSSGTLLDPQGGFGNFDNPVDAGQQQGNLHRLIAGALIDIAGWPANHIYIRSIPKSFERTLYTLMVKEAEDTTAEYQRLIERISRILGVGLQGTSSGGLNLTPVDPSTIDVQALAKMPPGNMTGEQVAAVFYAAGWRGDDLITMVAIARQENSWTTSNTPNGFAGCGTWPGAPDAGCVGLLQMSAGKNGQTFYSHIHPNGVVATYGKLADPTVQATMGWSLYLGRGGSKSGNGGSDTRFNDWQAYTDKAHLKWMNQATTAVNNFYKHRLNPKTIAQDAAKKATDDIAGAGKTIVGAATDLFDKVTGFLDLSTNSSKKSPTFLFPVKGPKTGIDVPPPTGSRSFNAPRPAYGNTGTHVHAGNDIGAPYGRPVVACVDGDVIFASSSGDAAGNTVSIYNSKNNRAYTYMHLSSISNGVAVGRSVKQGDVLGAVGNSGVGVDSVHLHFQIVQGRGLGGQGWAASDASNAFDPNPLLKASFAAGNLSTADSGDSSVAGGGGTDSSTQGALDENRVQQIARQAAWFTYSLPTVDSIESTFLSGNRALANDIPLFEWIQQMVAGSGRRFMSLPDGSFFAFFPDYFGWFGRTPYFVIKDIEILDLTIQVTDRELFTHIFATGTSFSPQINLLDRLGSFGSSMVASVEEEAFNIFINTGATFDKTKKEFVKSDFDPIPFLKRYGPRPDKVDLPTLKHPILIWMAAWSEFLKRWAGTFQANASFTFMPELLPGGLIELDGRIVMFVEEVTHNFDMSAGFSTSATLTSPAAKDPSDNRFGGMALAGMHFGVQAMVAEDAQISYQDGGGDPAPDANNKPVVVAPHKSIIEKVTDIIGDHIP